VTAPLRIGIAGLGVASTQMLPPMEAFPGVQLTAAADLRSDALEAFERRYRGRGYQTVDELAGDPNVDAIWVSTPNQFHCQHVVTCAEHGKHAVVEKPMGLSIEECERMVEAVERNGTKLLCGHTQSFNPAIRTMREIVASGELGKLAAVHTWMSTDWMLRPRMPQELDLALGGGVVYRQGPHQVDTVRLLGGGMVRSVRAMTGQLMPERPAPGNYTAFLEFEDGTPASIIYNGYGYFDTSELTWGIGNRLYSDAERVEVRSALANGTFDNDGAKEGMRFGAGPANGATSGDARDAAGTRAHIGWFGVTVASFERGDVRQSPNGLYVYDANGRREIPVFGGRGTGMLEMREMFECLSEGTPIVHDGRWALATLEVGMAIAESGKQRREIILSHQTACMASTR
jgi:phthalate 4,5-cis-dihydrodiol dehydrogenase